MWTRFCWKCHPQKIKKKKKTDRKLYPVIVHGELYLTIKRKLYSGWKDDPATRVEIRIDQDVFDEGLAKAGKPGKERGKTVYRVDSNEDLNHFGG